jgi:hypothetical protein
MPTDSVVLVALWALILFVLPSAAVVATLVTIIVATNNDSVLARGTLSAYRIVSS